jgi:NhaA family Na+:H+ antiporter
VVWGIILGLFFGKQLGVFLFTWICVILHWCKLPKQTTWFQLYGIGILCGIGFTMSLFIGTLSFNGQTAAELISVRFGILVASMLSGVIGYLLLSASSRGSSSA